MTATEYVILVDENDAFLGTAPKLYAHEQALLHRAFSVFVYRMTLKNDEIGVEWLLQQRAAHKYHSPSSWTNTCCSHPRPDEETAHAAARRLQEEMGLSVPLTHVGQFKYKAVFDNGLTEHEIDHVFIGIAQENCHIQINPEEVASYRWVKTTTLEHELNEKPNEFTPWFQAAWQIARQRLA